MAKLTREQRSFLKKMNVPTSRVFDAEGWKTAAYQSEMEEEEKWLAIGVNWPVLRVSIAGDSAELTAESMHSFTASGPANRCKSLKSVMLFMLRKRSSNHS